MKFHEIHIENFGIFSDRPFEFGDARFQLIYGPNEAGKSTLLELFRQVLFGFPNGSSPYQFETHSGEMAARAVVEISDGRRINFRRRKGRKGTVVGEVEGSTEKIDESKLNALLGNASLDLYQHVFGFSLNELSRGEESLKHANLNEAMFGGSLGGLSNLQEIQKSLESEAGLLFKPGARNPTINALQKEIVARQAEIREAALKPRDFEDREKALREAQEQVTSLSESREQAERQRAHLERLCQAVEPWLARKAIQEELDQISIPEGVTVASRAELEGLQKELLDASSATDEAVKELAETERNLGSLELAPEFLQAESQIRTLEKELSRIQRDLELVPQLRSQSRTIQSEVESRLLELNPAWDLTYLDAFRSSLEQREKLDELAAQWSQLEKQKAELAARRPDLQQRVEEAEARLAELKVVQAAPELDELLERESAYRAAVASLQDVGEAQASLMQRSNELRKRLTPLLATPDLTDDELAALPVPLESLLRSFQERCDSAESVVSVAQTKLQQGIDDLRKRQAELAARAAEDQVPDRSQLEDQRERRDSGWKLIRRKFFEESAESADSVMLEQEIENWAGDAKTLPDLYEREVFEADRLADDRQSKAEVVAIRDRLLIEIDQLENSLAAATAGHEEALEHQRDVISEWQKLLAEFKAQSHPPQVLLEWRQLFESWLEVRTKLSESQVRSQRLTETVAEFENRVTQQSSCDSGKVMTSALSIDQCLAAIRRRAEDFKATALERRQIEKSLPTDRKSLEKLDQDDVQLESQQAGWRAAWSSLLSEFNFPVDWSARIALKMLQGLHDARQKHHESRSLAERADVLQDEISKFQSDARAVSLEVCPELSDFPVAEMVTRLVEKLVQALQADREHSSLQRDLEKLSDQVKARRQDVDRLSGNIDRLLKTAGIPSPEEFLKVSQQAQRQQELLVEQAALTRDLKGIAAAEHFEEFLEELGNSDTDTLPLKLAEARKQHEDIGVRRDEALRLESEAKSALQSMDGTSKAAALQLDQEGSYARLAAAVDRLVPLVLAQTLLKRAVERFEKEHQPAMLANVGQLLSRMTGGRYVGIRRRLDETGTMQVEHRDGKLKTPDQLSTGTREQLYLAIRLAYVQHYCRDSEPLPLVMDDILVNFDRQRARSTLEVLFDLPGEIQVLFLTCHSHMVELIRELRPDSTPIELSTG